MSALEKTFETVSPVSNKTRSRPIDLVHLSRQSLGDPGLESEILRMFDQLVLTHMSRIRETLDIDVIQFNLHALKGASLGVGAQNIADLARAAEDELREDGKLCHESLADLRMAVEEVRHFIADLLGD